MFEKELLFGDEARQSILRGAEKVAKAVVSTLGPHGRNVVIRRGPMRPPLITKDGVTVAKEIKAFPDYYEDIGLQMVKEAASKTNDSAGDGTTTATLLAFEMMKEGLSHILKGSNSIHIRRGMQLAADNVYEELEKMKVIVDSPDQFKAIATISSQDEEIGSLVSLVVSEVGKDGAITVEAAQSIGMTYELTEGMQLSSGFASVHFVNRRDSLICAMEKPYILLCDERITSIDQILPAIELVNARNAPLVIIAESVESDAMSALVVNLPQVKIKGQNPEDKTNFESLAIRAPEIGDRRNEVLEDLAVKTGGKVISKKVGLSLKSLVIEDFGRADRVVSTQYTTTIVNGEGSQEAIAGRAQQIKEMIDQAQTDEEKDFLKGRLANLNGRIGVIRVGAASEVEQKEKQHRVEDAIAAVRAASEEGIVSGGGTAYLECIECIEDGNSDDETIGVNIVRETLKKPLWWIAQNAGYEADEVVQNVLKGKGGRGFNAETGKYVDMIKEKIIDPKKVSRCALENAVSIAGAFLTLEVAICGLPGSDPQMQ